MPKYSLLFLVIFCTMSISLFTQEKSEPFWRVSHSPNASDVRVMAQDSSNNLYAAVWGDGIYKSTTKGDTWVKISTGLTNTYVNCMEIDKYGKIYAGTMGSGLFISTNSGGSWAPKNDGLDNLNVKAVGIGYDSTVYTGTYGGGVFRSDNGGNKWVAASNGLNFRDINCIAVTEDTSVVAGTNGGGIYKSTNGGASWYQVGTNMKSKTITDMAKAKYGEVFALAYGGGVYVSYMNGSEWQAYFHSMKDMPVYGKCLNLYEGDYPVVGLYHDGLIVYDIMYAGIPDSSGWRKTKKYMMGINDVVITNENKIFAADPYNGIQMTTNKGRDFDTVQRFYWDYSNKGMAPMITYNDIILTSSIKGGIWKSSDKGESWTLTGLDGVQIYYFCSDESGNFYAATESGPYKSANQGGSWTKLGWSNPVYSIAVKGSTLFIADSAIRRSTNGGSSWTVASSISAEYTMSKLMEFSRFGTLFVMLSNELYRSTDNGNTFHLTIDLGTDIVLSFAERDNKVYIGTVKGLMISTDEGSTWNSKLVNGVTIPYISKIMFTNAGDMYLVSENYHYVLHSTNEGTTCDTVRAGAVRSTPKSAAINSDGDIFLSTSMLYRSITSSDLQAPTLSLPVDEAGAVEVNPYLIWNTVANTDLYEVELSLGSDFTEIVESAVIDGSQWRVYNKLDYGTKYFWRARSKRNKSCSDWSEVRWFTTTTAPPELEYPPDSSYSIDTNVTFAWKKVESASSYQLQVATDEGFGNIVLDKNKLAAITQKASGLTLNTEYFWRVRSLSSTSNSNWSETWVFTTKLAAPVLLKPTDKAITQSADVTVKWDTVPGAATYNIVLASDPDFNNIVYDSLSTTDSTFVYGLYEVGKTYYWKVRALNLPNEGYWSETHRFTISQSQLTLIYPQNNSRNIPNNTEFEWNGPENAQRYHLQVASDPAFKNITAEDSSVTGTKKTLPGLTYNVYYWRVRYILDNNFSEWTETWKFTTDPGLALLMSPVNDSVNIAIPAELTWDAPKIAESFIIEVATDINFKDVKYSKNKLTDKKVSVPGLQNYTKYYWHVRFVVKSDTSAWSETWAFTSTLGRTYLVSPDNDVANCDPTTVFIWKTVKGATNYQLQIARDNAFGDIYRNYEDINDTFKLVMDMDTNTTFYWRVKALYGEGDGAWSVIWMFKTKAGRVSVEDDYYSGVVNQQAYPNPFSEATVLEYTLDKESYVEIYVIDATGSRVATLQEGAVLPQGRKQLLWDASRLSQGTYYYCISINKRESAYKLLKVN